MDHFDIKTRRADLSNVPYALLSVLSKDPAARGAFAVSYGLVHHGDDVGSVENFTVWANVQGKITQTPLDEIFDNHEDYAYLADVFFRSNEMFNIGAEHLRDQGTGEGNSFQLAVTHHGLALISDDWITFKYFNRDADVAGAFVDTDLNDDEEAAARANLNQIIEMMMGAQTQDWTLSKPGFEISLLAA